MANLSRFIGMASKVISKQMQQRGQGSAPVGNRQPPQGGTDWRDMVRSAADKLTGDDRSQPQPPQYGQRPPQQQYGQPQQHTRPQQPGPVDADKVALAKYDYLLRTASPDQLEQVHHDAFARLTPEQRQQVLQRMNAELPPHDRPADASAGGLARAMTRGEVARPGMARRVLGGAAVGAGAMALGGIAVAVAGGAVMSAAAGPVLAGAADLGLDFEGIASGFGDVGLADLGGDLGAGVDGLTEQASGLGEQASGLGEQASGLGNDLLGGLFDR
ncbi:cation-transporting ATPase [Microbacterium sp. M1A1_1b]